MCGIVGMAGDLSLKEEGLFKYLLFTDTIRGSDSTGMAVVSKSDELKTGKMVGPATDFFDVSMKALAFNTKIFDKLLYGSNKIIIGHNRAKTKGKVSKANAHPFTHGKITGVHNGTLSRQSLLPDHVNFDVDSENIFYSMDKIGEQETLEKLDGAFALVWWNAETKTLNIARNAQRPFTYIYTKDRKHMLYASEGEMLSWLADREGVEWDDESVDHIPDANKWYKFKIDGTKAIPAPEVVEFESPKPLTSHSHGKKTNQWGQKHQAKKNTETGNKSGKTHSPSTTTALTVTSTPEEVSTRTGLTFFRMIRTKTIGFLGFRNAAVTGLKAVALLEEGCTSCGVVVKPNPDSNTDAYFYTDTDYICVDCKEKLNENSRWSKYVA